MTTAEYLPAVRQTNQLDGLTPDSMETPRKRSPG